jgi:predicted N-formylglutamate amidohydrolase
MPAPGESSASPRSSLLAADEPAPFVVVNGDSTRPILLVCDHASRVIPRALGDLGLDPLARRCHLALDIGAGALARALAHSLGTTAVFAGYSRLVVDCNRDLLDAGAFLEFGDGIVIPGNRGLTEADRQARADAIYWPYHRAIAAEIERLRGYGSLPAIISVHSFTPVLNGISRPWQLGILWDADRRIAEPLIDGLRAAGFIVGDNEPYSGRAPQDFTIDHHGEAGGLPHCGIEVRQDRIDHEEGVQEIAAHLHRLIAALPAELFSVSGEGAPGRAERASATFRSVTGQK